MQRFTESDILDAFQGKLASSLLESVQGLLSQEKTIDEPVLEQADWKVIVNIRPTVEETRPEMHRDWHDVSLYLIGANNISVGSSLSNAFEKEPGNGEWRSGTIIDEQQLKVSTHDLILIPADIPHQNHLDPATAFFVLKVRKGKESQTPVQHLFPDWMVIKQIPGFAVTV